MQEFQSRTYRPEDHAACLSAFASNVPEYFAPHEQGDFLHFLGGPVHRRPYLVIEYQGKVIACGGLAIIEDKRSAFLSWGMVTRSFHGKGIGRLLTETRLALARATPGIDNVTLNTSQHTKAFYSKFGFETERVTPDGYGPGLDRWDMILNLT